ncbi:MAG: flagellin hook IN motif-containing protein [Alphaproteobacteria bacterium]|nr:flagellin hook IN motif-containing protein [Alphaproteobacteria bacterium]
MATGDVVLSSALRNNLLSLQNTQRSIDIAQLRLATGLRVNSALDNPQNFFTAKALNNRASDLTRLLDGIGQSIRTIEQANTGVETLSQLLDQADSIASEAQSEIRASEGYARARGNVDLSQISDLVNIGGGGIINDGAADSFDVTIVDSDGVVSATVNIDIDAGETVDNIVADLNSNATFAAVGTARVTSAGYLEIASDVENSSIRIQSAAANGLSSAGFAALGLDTIVGTEDDGAGGFRQGGSAIAGNTLFSAQAAAGALNGSTYEASTDLVTAGYLGAAGDDIEIDLTIDGVVSSVTPGAISITGADTIQDVVDAINNNGPSTVSASFNTETGKIEIQFDETVGQVELQFTANAASTTSFGFGAGGADAAIALGDISSEFFTFDGVNPDVDQFEEDYNNIRDQINQLVEDSNYRGVNLLQGDNLETFFNEDRSNSLTTEGVDFTADGLGIREGDFTNAANVQLSIDDIRDALASVRNFGQSIANDLSIVQFRRDFTEQTINTLQSGADDLVVADQNEEGANLLALQTRQALGTTSLSLAAQSQQAVLRLF